MKLLSDDYCLLVPPEVTGFWGITVCSLHLRQEPSLSHTFVTFIYSYNAPSWRRSGIIHVQWWCVILTGLVFLISFRLLNRLLRSDVSFNTRTPVSAV